MASAPTIREATQADVPSILTVLKLALGETPLLERTPSLFEWKHSSNPFGPSIVLLAELDERVVGVRAFMRWNLLMPAGGTLRCVRAVDTATHPEYMRRGIFRALTESAIEVASDSGIDMVFNTPNPKSAAGYLKMGWQEVGHVGAMVRPRMGRARRPLDGRPATIEHQTPEVSGYKARAIEDRAPLGLRTPRTLEYLTWRFTGHPTARYGCVEGDSGQGAVIRPSARNGRTETIVADLLGSKGQTQSMRKAAAASKSRYAAAWFSRGTPERRSAIKAGFLPIPGVSTLHLVARPLTSIDIDVFDISSWDFAISDLELL